MKNKFRVFVWVAVLALLGTACDHKELCYDHRHTTVRVRLGGGPRRGTCGYVRAVLPGRRRCSRC